MSGKETVSGDASSPVSVVAEDEIAFAYPLFNVVRREIAANQDRLQVLTIRRCERSSCRIFEHARWSLGLSAPDETAPGTTTQMHSHQVAQFALPVLLLLCTSLA